MAEVIVCERLSKTYGARERAGEVAAVKDVSISVKAGDSVGLMGPNGAGKSSLLAMIAGIVIPTSGAVRRSGRCAAIIGLGASFHPDLNGFENLYLYGSLIGLSRHELKRRRDRIIEFSGLQEHMGRPVGHYSTGMQGRLAVSIALHADVDLLLVDEVLAVGDLEFAQRALLRLRELNHQGVTLVMASHDVQSLDLVCSRGILLIDGSVAIDASFQEMAETYLGSTRDVGRGGPIEVDLQIDDRSITVGDPLRYRARVSNPMAVRIDEVLIECGYMVPDPDSGFRTFRSTVSGRLNVDVSEAGEYEWSGVIDSAFFPGGSISIRVSLTDSEQEVFRSELFHVQFESEHPDFRLHIPSTVSVLP